MLPPVVCVVMEDYPRNLQEFSVRFGSDEACREYLCQLRWPEGFRCPRCGCGESAPVRTTLLRCHECRYQVEVVPEVRAVFAFSLSRPTKASLVNWLP